jgi:hypothetical protein
MMQNSPDPPGRRDFCAENLPESRRSLNYKNQSERPNPTPTLHVRSVGCVLGVIEEVQAAHEARLTYGSPNACMAVFLIGSQVCNLYANMCICCAMQVVYPTAQNSGTEAHSAEEHASANGSLW